MRACYRRGVTDPRIGAVVAERYRVLERLAQGGMGAVYRGEHIELGREVAIKFLHEWAATEPSFVKRFEVEARAMARLQHPNVAQVIDVGVVSGAPFVVMELVGGQTLYDLLDGGPVVPARAIELGRQVLAALAHAHGHGVVHRDIKPANLIVASSEFGDQVKVLDFGLAKIAAGATGLTGAFAVGTPSYMPPEQGLGGQVDARTDLYAVGVLLFELLTGAPPFVRDDPAEVIAAHRTTPPPRLVDRMPGRVCSSELETVVARALAKSPDDRYQTAGEFARALTSVPEAAVRVGAMTPPPMPLLSRAEPAGTMVLGTDALIPMPTPDRSAAEVAPVPAPLEVAPPTPLPFTPPVRLPSPLIAPRGAPRPPSPIDRARSWLRLRAPWQRVAILAAPVVLVIAIVAAALGGGDAKPAPPAAALASGPVPTEVVAEPTSGLEALRSRLRGADTDDSDVRALQRLGVSEPGNAEIPLVLGQIYCARLWVSDCLPSLRKAMALDPAMRDDARLVRAAMYGLGNDRAHGDVRRFVVREVGAAAVPYLTEVVDGRWRKEVKERAALALRELSMTAPPP